MSPIGIQTCHPHRLGALYTIWNLQALDMYRKKTVPLKPPRLYCVAQCIATARQVIVNLDDDERDFLAKYRHKQTVLRMLLTRKRHHQGRPPECPHMLFFEPDGTNGWREIQLEDLPLYFFLEGTPYLEEQTNRLRSLL